MMLCFAALAPVLGWQYLVKQKSNENNYGWVLTKLCYDPYNGGIYFHWRTAIGDAWETLKQQGYWAKVTCKGNPKSPGPCEYAYAKGTTYIFNSQNVLVSAVSSYVFVS